MPKLNQVIAIEKGTKARLDKSITELHKESMKPELFYGFTRTYEPKDEDGDQLPPESKKVVLRADEVLVDLRRYVGELMDITATKDFANTTAKADVTIDGEVLLKDAPVPYLLFLEKQLTEVRTFLTKMPTLDENDDWSRDEVLGLYKTAVVQKNRTANVQKPIVRYDATPEHPAQTDLITQVVTIGRWNETKQSGAITRRRRQELLDKTEQVLNAVKSAREEANGADAPPRQVGQTLLGYIFA